MKAIGTIRKNEERNGMELIIESKLSREQMDFLYKVLGFRYLKADRLGGRKGFWYRKYDQKVWDFVESRVLEKKAEPAKAKKPAKKAEPAKAKQSAKKVEPAKEDLSKKLSRMTKAELVAYIVANATA